MRASARPVVGRVRGWARREVSRREVRASDTLAATPDTLAASPTVSRHHSPLAIRHEEAAQIVLIVLQLDYVQGLSGRARPST